VVAGLPGLVGSGLSSTELSRPPARVLAALGAAISATVTGIGAVRPGGTLPVAARRETGEEVRFEVVVRLDSETDLDYYRNGGILPMVLRQLAAGSSPAAG